MQIIKCLKSNENTKSINKCQYSFRFRVIFESNETYQKKSTTTNRNPLWRNIRVIWSRFCFVLDAFLLRREHEKKSCTKCNNGFYLPLNCGHFGCNRTTRFWFDRITWIQVSHITLFATTCPILLFNFNSNWNPMQQWIFILLQMMKMQPSTNQFVIRQSQNQSYHFNGNSSSIFFLLHAEKAPTSFFETILISYIAHSVLLSS